MAEKVVLSEMVVRISGDNKDFQSKVKGSEQAAQRFGRNAAQAGNRLRTTFDAGAMAVGKISPAANMAVQGFRSMGVAGGAILVAAAAAKKLVENTFKANEAANAAFQSMVTGARTADQAFRDIRVNTLTKGFEEIERHVNPQGFLDWGNVAFNAVSGLTQGTDGLGAAVNRVVGRVESAQAAFRRLNDDPGIRRLRESIAFDRNVNAARDSARALEDEADRAGLAADASRRFEMAQRLAREGSITLTQALDRLAPSLDRVRDAQLRISQGRVGLQVRELEDTADRSRLLAMESERLAIAQRFARENSIGLGDALRRLTPELNRMRDAQAEIAVGEFTQDLQRQVRTFGLSAEQARIFELRLQGVTREQLRGAEAAAEQLRALRLLSQPYTAPIGVRLGSAEDFEARENYRQQRRLIDLQSQGQLIPQGAGGPVTNVGVRAGSAEDREARAHHNEIRTLLQQIARNGGRPGINVVQANLQE